MKPKTAKDYKITFIGDSTVYLTELNKLDYNLLAKDPIAWNKRAKEIIKKLSQRKGTA